MLLALDSSLLSPRLVELGELRGGAGGALQRGWALLSPPSSRLTVASPRGTGLLPGALNTKLEQGLPEVSPRRWWSRD